jgi:hypothetical protein
LFDISAMPQHAPRSLISTATANLMFSFSSINGTGICSSRKTVYPAYSSAFQPTVSYQLIMTAMAKRCRRIRDGTWYIQRSQLGFTGIASEHQKTFQCQPITMVMEKLTLLSSDRAPESVSLRSQLGFTALLRSVGRQTRRC